MPVNEALKIGQGALFRSEGLTAEVRGLYFKVRELSPYELASNIPLPNSPLLCTQAPIHLEEMKLRELGASLAPLAVVNLKLAINSP